MLSEWWSPVDACISHIVHCCVHVSIVYWNNNNNNNKLTGRPISNAAPVNSRHWPRVGLMLGHRLVVVILRFVVEIKKYGVLLTVHRDQNRLTYIYITASIAKKSLLLKRNESLLFIHVDLQPSQSATLIIAK